MTEREAMLVLEDGSAFVGQSFGASVDAEGEVLEYATSFDHYGAVEGIGVDATGLYLQNGEGNAFIVKLGLAVQLCGERDRRCKVYCLTEPVVEAWESLFDHVQTAVPSILARCGPSEIADLDFAHTPSRAEVPTKAVAHPGARV